MKACWSDVKQEIETSKQQTTHLWVFSFAPSAPMLIKICCERKLWRKRGGMVCARLIRICVTSNKWFALASSRAERPPLILIDSHFFSLIGICMGGCEITYSNLSNALAMEHTISISLSFAAADLHSKLKKRLKIKNYRLCSKLTKVRHSPSLFQFGAQLTTFWTSLLVFGVKHKKRRLWIIGQFGDMQIWCRELLRSRPMLLHFSTEPAI